MKISQKTGTRSTTLVNTRKLSMIKLVVNLPLRQRVKGQTPRPPALLTPRELAAPEGSDLLSWLKLICLKLRAKRPNSLGPAERANLT